MPEAEPEPESKPEPRSAIEVAKYLDDELGFDYSLAGGDAAQVVTAFDNADVRVEAFDSEAELRAAQRRVDEALGGIQPTHVECGVIEVEVAADETPDRAAVEQDYARDIKRALDKKYRC